MATIYYEKDADRSALAGQRVAVLGFGSQGHAHALNLKDSGHDVRVGLREGSTSWPVAVTAGARACPSLPAPSTASRWPAQLGTGAWRERALAVV